MIEVGYLLGFYGGMLTDRQQALLDAYYNQDLSLSEIAQQEGISRQGVHDAIRRGEQELRNLEERLGFAANHQCMRGKLLSAKSALASGNSKEAMTLLNELIQSWED